jgi:RNA polymerase sigma factor (sigma-70 family)
VASIVASIVRTHNFPWRPDQWRDLMQAGFLGLLEACHDYNPSRSSFRTYADRRINWAVKAAIARDNPKLQIVGGRDYAYDDDFALPEQIDPAPRPDRAYELRETLDSLSPRQRQLLRLRLSGYTQEQAAREMGISRVAVTNLEARALRNLRQRQQMPIRRAA